MRGLKPTPPSGLSSSAARLSARAGNWPTRFGVLFAVRPTLMNRLLAVCLIGAALGAAATPARADRDAVQFFSDIRVAPDAAVHDAVCFFCSANIEGEAKGNVVVFFGNVHLAGKADHDVVNFFGKVSAEDKAQIGNSLVSFFGMIRLGEDVSVGKDMVSMFGVVRAPESVSVGKIGRASCRERG